MNQGPLLFDIKPIFVMSQYINNCIMDSIDFEPCEQFKHGLAITA